MSYVVIGGGVAGLVAAHTLCAARPGAEVVVIERNAELGGLLGGTRYADEGLHFDLGTHIFQETGTEEIDGWLRSAVAPDNLIHFPPGEGDLSGAVFGGRLQRNSHFPDLRQGRAPEGVIAALRAHVAQGGPLPELDRHAPLMEVATARFGAACAERVIGPPLEAAFGRPAADLSAFALLLPGWTRVILDDQADWEAQADDERYRAIVAVPDQRDLPARFRHDRRSFYARRGGTRAFIDGLEAALAARGVRFWKGVRDLSLEAGATRVAVTDAEGRERTLAVDGVVLATGVFGAAGLLGADLASRGFDRPMPHWIVNLVAEEVREDALCYLYGLDDCPWYRLTNYRAFSGDPDDRRLTVEIVGAHKAAAAETPELVLQSLHRHGLTGSAASSFLDVFRLPAGFPSPTTNNLTALTRLGRDLSADLPGHVLLCGIGASEGRFFQNEIVLDTHRRVGDRFA